MGPNTQMEGREDFQFSPSTIGLPGTELRLGIKSRYPQSQLTFRNKNQEWVSGFLPSTQYSPGLLFTTWNPY